MFRRPSVEKVVPAGEDDSHTAAESAYLEAVLRANKSIKDGISGEELDIRTQCVGVTLASQRDAARTGQNWPVPGHCLDEKPHPTDIKIDHHVVLVTHSNFAHINGL